MNRLRLFALKLSQIIFVGACLHVSLALGNSSSDAQYQSAVELARAGNTAQALDELEQLVQNYPEIERYQYDYIQILTWAGRNEDALAQESSINVRNAPIYVLESLAKAARNTKNFQHAEQLYHLALANVPGRIESQVGVALVMIDQNRADSAIGLLTDLSKTYPQNTDVLLALAYAYESKKQFPKAVTFYENILAQHPDHKEAKRGLIFDLNASGAAHLAHEKAESNRELFSDDEWARFSWAVAATKIRWGDATPFEGKQRYDETDAAIKKVEENIASVKTLNLKEPDVWQHRAEIDRMVALRNRNRMQDVVKQYDILTQQKVTIPAYGRSAVADAFLYLEQPEKARDLYLSVIKEFPKDFNARSSLVYAYLEAEQYDDALSLAQQLAKEQPDKLRFKPADGAAYTKGNPKKTRAELMSANLDAYGDRLADAVERLEKLYGKASFNPDIRHDLAQAYYYRGWPRKAEKNYEMARNMAPKHLGLKTGHTEVLRDLREYRKTEKETKRLVQDFPDDKGVQKQARLWDIHNDWEWKSFNSGGLSKSDLSNTNNNPKGSEDIRLDNYVYTPPLDYNYRIFAHQGWGTGLFPLPITAGNPSSDNALRGYIRTYGLGLEYSARNILATSEIHYDSFGQTGVGVALGGSYDFNDNWQVSAGFDSLDNTISLRALANGIRATTGRVGATYRVHESRQFDLGAQYTAYSGKAQSPGVGGVDDNDRFAVNGSYFERWYSGPRYKFGTYVNAGFSTNSANFEQVPVLVGNNQTVLSSNVPYFNPRNDAYVSLTLDNNYLTYRYYDFSFHQRLALSVGNYWQDGFGSNITGGFQYEHLWKAFNRFELTYGVSRMYTAYDGVPTANWLFYLNSDLRF